MPGAVNSDALLKDISAYCRNARMAESTFGRLAVNDGKFVSRLRFGGKVRGPTAERVRQFISARGVEPATLDTPPPRLNGAPAPVATPGAERNFRFFDN